MQKLIMAAAISVVAAGPAAAHHKNLHHITCEMVRAYVARVGLAEARTIALAHGMTASQERRARRCLGG